MMQEQGFATFGNVNFFVPYSRGAYTLVTIIGNRELCENYFWLRSFNY